MTVSSSINESGSKFGSASRFSTFSLISLLIWWHPLTASIGLAIRDDRYTHLLLIFPVSLGLLYMNWKPSEASFGSGSSVGFILLVTAILAILVARFQISQLRSDERLSLEMLGLAAWWIGSFVVSFGMRAFRRAFFPLCFLFWLVPFPEFVLNPIVHLLQQGSAASAHLLFAMFGVPAVQSGTLISIPKLTLEVAPECSSIRSSLMLVVTTMVVAQISLGSVWRKALVVAVAIPLSVAKNGLRIFVLAMLGTRVDGSFLTGRLHHQGGIIYFVFALVAIFWLIWVLRRYEDQGDLAPATAR